MSFISMNPSTGETLSTYPEMELEETLQRVEKAHDAFKNWKDIAVSQRASWMKKVAERLMIEKQSLARLMTEEMGKPIRQAEAEIEKCISLCAYFADNAEAFLKPEIIKTEAQKSYVAYEPLGVILAIMPWNFPFWQVFRAAIPAILAGNTMLLKHASNVPGCAQAIEKIFQESDFPESVFQNLFITSAATLSLIELPHIQGITLTGSVNAGRSVGAKAGEYLKKCVLELGGSDPYLILEDADLENAAAICAQSRLVNSGQSCIAAKRFIIVEPVFEAFQTLFVNHMKNAVMGNPLHERTTVGPLARLDLRDELHQHVTKSLNLGAQCLLGGYIPEGVGAFYPPTVLTNVEKGMPAYDTELFGPVATLIKAKNEEEAFFIANDTSYGLGAAVFTQNIKKGEQIAEKTLQAGLCFVNSMVKSDPRLPFGGVKKSGFGRELSCHGIREFVNIKTVYVT